MVCSMLCRAQMASGYFHTIGQGERYGKVVAASDFPRDSITTECSQPSEQEVQMVKPKATAPLKKYPRTRSYRNWEERELTMFNLLEVIREVGLTNGLIVLAQALLETGYFKSRVCKEYNNLFGLYDSKNREYFRFCPVGGQRGGVPADDTIQIQRWQLLPLSQKNWLCRRPAVSRQVG
jgi:hypothetical protein